MTLKPLTSTKNVLLTGLSMATLVFAGCQNAASPAGPIAGEDSVSVTASAPAAAQKSGDTTRTGKVVEANGKYYLQVSGSLQEIDSYSVALADYVGKIVTVTGQFSGDALFVAKIQAE